MEELQQLLAKQREEIDELRHSVSVLQEQMQGVRSRLGIGIDRVGELARSLGTRTDETAPPEAGDALRAVVAIEQQFDKPNELVGVEDVDSYLNNQDVQLSPQLLKDLTKKGLLKDHGYAWRTTELGRAVYERMRNEQG